MAILFCDSFDHYTTTSEMETKWASRGAWSIADVNAAGFGVKVG